MTLNEVTNQIYSLTIAGYINREKFTKDEFRRYMSHWFEHCNSKTFTIEVALPDGWWNCRISKIADGYDYYIPDTREQEKILISEIGKTR